MSNRTKADGADPLFARGADDGAGLFLPEGLGTHALVVGDDPVAVTDALSWLAGRALGEGMTVTYVSCGDAGRVLARLDPTLPAWPGSPAAPRWLSLRDCRGDARSRYDDSLGFTALNPFLKGKADTLTWMLAGLMDDAGRGGDMWKGRATVMLSGVMRALVHLRDAGLLDLDPGTVRDFLDLRRIIDLGDLSKFPEMPVAIRKAIASYLASLPGYQPEKGYKQAQSTLDHHGYLEMHYTRILGSLADVYAHVSANPADPSSPDASGEGPGGRGPGLNLWILPDHSNGDHGKLAYAWARIAEAARGSLVVIDAALPPGRDDLRDLSRLCAMNGVSIVHGYDASQLRRDVLDFLCASGSTFGFTRTRHVPGALAARLAPSARIDRVARIGRELERVSALAAIRARSGAAPRALAALADRYEALMAECAAEEARMVDEDVASQAQGLREGEMLVVRGGVSSRLEFPRGGGGDTAVATAPGDAPNRDDGLFPGADHVPEGPCSAREAVRRSIAVLGAHARG